MLIYLNSAKGLEGSANKLSKATGKRCIPASADVRKTSELEAAVEKTKSELGRIDFVICGAAGNLYVPRPHFHVLLINPQYRSSFLYKTRLYLMI